MSALTYDPAHYRQCPVCAAELGTPCLSLSGFVVADGVAVGLEGAQIAALADRPHDGRPLRAEASRG